MAKGIKYLTHWRFILTRAVGVENDRLEAGGLSSRSGVDPGGLSRSTSRAYVLGSPILVRCRVSFSTAVFPRLQVWCLYCKVFIQTFGDLQLQVLHVLHFCLTDTLLQPCKYLEAGGQNNVASTRVPEYQRKCYRHRGLRAHRSIRHVCIL